MTSDSTKKETRVPEFLSVQCSMIIVATIVVVLRLYTRRFIRNKFGPDDYCIAAALFLAIVGTICQAMGVKGGTGLHKWDVPSGVDKLFAARISYVTQMTYMPTIQLTKISALLFFLQINPDPAFRRSVFILIGICTAFCLSVIFSDLFQCKPMQKAWLGSLYDGGHCFDQLAFFKSTAIINILLDFAIVFLPMPMLWNVQRPARQRLLLCLVFAVGLFVCVASIVRLSMWFRPHQLRNNPDATWSRVDIADWSTIEYCVGLICASLPHLKALVALVLPRVFGSSAFSKSDKRQYNTYGSTVKGAVSSRGRLRNGSQPLGSGEDADDIIMDDGIIVTKTFDNTSTIRRDVDSEEEYIMHNMGHGGVYEGPKVA